LKSEIAHKEEMIVKLGSKFQVSNNFDRVLGEMSFGKIISLIFYYSEGIANYVERNHTRCGNRCCCCAGVKDCW
jgi:hypothetical protein